MEFSRGAAPARERYRFLAWNIERGTQLEAQLEAFRSHPYLKTCDVLLLTEADAGMARSGNRMVAEALARELGMAQVFAPCYIALGKGSGVERHVEGDNTWAARQRHPQPLSRSATSASSRSKRRGQDGASREAPRPPAAVAARVDFPNPRSTPFPSTWTPSPPSGIAANRCAASSTRLPPGLPVILGGDWNTSTYDSSHAFRAILGFWLRVMMGVDHVIRNHYLHPEHRFEKELFGR